MLLAPQLKAEGAFWVFFAGVFFALAAQIAFLPIWYKERGLSETEIGLITMLGLGLKTAASIALPAAADRAGRPGAALALIALVGLAAAAAHLIAPNSLVWLAPLGLIIAMSFAGLMPLGEASCWASGQKNGFTFRRARAAGSAAFLAATLTIGALIAALGEDVVIFVMVAAFGVAVLGGRLIERFSGLNGASALRAPPSLRDGLRLLRRRRFAAIVGAAAMITASHAVIYVYGSIHWRALGITDTAIGVLWAWGVVAEIALFAFGGRILELFGAPRCLLIGGALAALRWVLMTLDPGFWGAAAVQTLHAGSFALAHLAAVALVAREAPEGLAGSAQGVMSAASAGVGMMSGTMLATWAYPHFGGDAYWIGALFAVAGVGLARLVAVNAAEIARAP